MDTGDGTRKAALAQMERALDEQGLRSTAPRRTILRVLASMQHPFTPTELTEQVAAADDSIGRASVYRLLQLLRSRDIVERLHGPADEQYLLCLEEGHHHHIVCEVCGRTQSFTLEDTDAIARAVERLGYRMHDHVLQVYGCCPECLSKQDANGR